MSQKDGGAARAVFVIATQVAGLCIVENTLIAADERQTVWKVFAERQEVADTASVTWTETFHMSAATVRINLVDSPASVRTGTVTDINPPPARCTLSVSGEQACRYESVGLSFAGENVGVPYRSIITYDDSGTYWSFSERTGASQRHSGRIDERDSPPVWDVIHIKPLIFALRPLRPEAFGPNPEHWVIEDSAAIVDSRSCIVMRSRPIGSNAMRTHRVYLDAERLLPLRYTSEDPTPGRLNSKIDIRYQGDGKPSWVPSWWKVSVYRGAEALSEASESDGVKVELGLTLPAETFRIDYPAATIVSDGRPGGGMKVIADDGRLVPRRLAVAEATKDSGWDWWFWGIAGLGCAALGAALLIWRRSMAS